MASKNVVKVFLIKAGFNLLNECDSVIECISNLGASFYTENKENDAIACT
jgi:hypothetical protein